MPLFVFDCSVGCAVGVHESIVVKAESEEEAEEMAREWWIEYVSPEVAFDAEVTDENAEDYEYYERIN